MIVAEGDGVDPAGAQNGPILDVGRCVPAMEVSGDADAADAEPVGDARAVITCGLVGEGGVQVRRREGEG